MYLALGTLATALAVAPPPAPPPAKTPEYPLAAPRGPCWTVPCAGSLLTDLALELGEPGGPRAGEARLLVDDRFYLGLRAGGDDRALSFATARWDLAAEHADDRAGLELEYRGPRVRLRARALDHEPENGGGWVAEAEAGFRLGPDLELVAFAVDDRRAGTVPATAPRPTASLALGALWQHGARFELGGRLLAATIETPGGIELDRRALELDGLYQAERWRLSAELAAEELSGRIERREATGAGRFDYRLTPQLVASAEASERYDLDLGSIGAGSALEVTYYARRFRFPRAGDAGRATVALARRAYELGFNERRAHDLGGRRRLRERLALSRAGTELAALADELYRAQIAERNVPLAGVALRRERDEIGGSRLRSNEAFVAIPWSRRARRDGLPALLHDEAATDFLRLTYGRSERDISRGFTTEGSLLAVDVALRRELSLRLSWEKPAATGLEFALRTQQPRLFLLELAYRPGL